MVGLRSSWRCRHAMSRCISRAIQRQSLRGRWKRMSCLCCASRTPSKDEITFVARNAADAGAISLWDRKENGNAYSCDTYPEVLKSLAQAVEETPQVVNYDVANSTCHQIAARE